ncbi:hypothetical protein IV203_014938 [Nitzschia inconspicua]|uniref:Uncharacterized protein n=1 Tax=Nitzschia inconspicua TaxID=303405 RepID=A0A9K3LAW8_9STRA|nr:hypothetical protein IV203_014938 [Nitzschia inconspicua]
MQKLTGFVEQKFVHGWDDVLMPTVRVSVVRRSVQVPALKAYIAFIYSQGASCRVVHLVWNSFWAEYIMILDASAKRKMAIDAVNQVPLSVINVPTEDSSTSLTAVNKVDFFIFTRMALSGESCMQILLGLAISGRMFVV